MTDLLNLDAFVLRAVLAALCMAMMAGAMGCLIVWQRMAYFGDSLAHSALLGVALSLLLQLPLHIGVLVVCVVFSILLTLLRRSPIMAHDTILGILAHSCLALGLVCLALMPSVRIDLHSYLFGDILSVRWRDVYTLMAVTVGVLSVLAWYWNALLRCIVHPDIAAVEGINVQRMQALHTALLTIMVAFAIQVIGILLVTAMLIIPAATARYLSTTPTRMAIMASILAMVASGAGVWASFTVDVPTSPTIVVAMTTLFFFTYTARSLIKPKEL